VCLSGLYSCESYHKVRAASRRAEELKRKDAKIAKENAKMH